ncbi:protein mono-ADP-ribosyltransferase PARP16-like [Tubulanus polymorphus]|uniref:protein mono-ADP-ribosyltransferase PARP16-like n=1 Tax=Tubulanus polymorphus TaxID=672921 RepID=UPI003DA23799
MAERTNGDDLDKALSDDTESVDFLWSLFFSALRSYKHDTLVRPFPPQFSTSNNEKDFKNLAKTASNLPALPLVKRNVKNIDENCSQLLNWLINCGRRNFTLSSCPVSKFKEIRALTKETLSSPTPKYIFELKYNEAAETKFKSTQGSSDLLYLYHGSRVENFYSILHHGLQCHMTKNALFGEGIYLSSELTVTMPYCPTGHGWEHSVLGDKLSCVAVCETIDHPSVKCQSADKDGVQQKSRTRIKDSLGGDIPEKYYVVQNNELLRVKYVLVYAERTKRSYRSSWWYQHRQMILVLSYAIMLLAVALFYNQNSKAYLRRWWRSFQQ